MGDIKHPHEPNGTGTSRRTRAGGIMTGWAIQMRMQTAQGDTGKHSPWRRHRARGAIVIGVALAAAGASFSYISQDVADVLSAALAVGVIMAVVGAWVKVGSVFAARLL